MNTTRSIFSTGTLRLMLAALAAILSCAACEKPAPARPPASEPPASQPAPAAIEWPAEYISPVDGARMLLVRGGEAELGSDPGDKNARTDEFPVQRESFEPFYMEETEVTIGRFGLFVEAGGYDNPGAWTSADWDWLRARGIKAPATWVTDETLDPDLPVTGMTYVEAETWARWAGRRLPTEMEWEYAARGTDRRIYPWGNELSGGFESSTDRRPVGSSGEKPSYWGLRDMGGSVREWTSSEYRRYDGSNDRTRDYGGGRMVARGGWFGGTPEDCLAARRTPLEIGRWSASLGFRTVIDARLAYPGLTAGR